MITLLAFTGLKNLNIDGACMNSVPILGQWLIRLYQTNYFQSLMHLHCVEALSSLSQDDDVYKVVCIGTKSENCWGDSPW
jgi:hypothetical protein